jgi:hypothetical protein
MEKTGKVFGGWLRLFFVIHLVFTSLLFAVLILSMLAFIAQMKVDVMVFMGFYILWSAMMLYIVVGIVGAAREPNQGSPNRIVRLIYMGLWISLIFHLGNILVSYFLDRQNLILGPSKLAGPLISILWYLAWNAYFRRSQRVKKYYGLNAGQSLSNK